MCICGNPVVRGVGSAVFSSESRWSRDAAGMPSRREAFGDRSTHRYRRATLRIAVGMLRTMISALSIQSPLRSRFRGTLTLNSVSIGQTR
jgi:hypothetical protein